MRAGIITRNENKSPKILALSLQAQLNEAGIESEIIYATDLLTRLQPADFSLGGLRRWWQRIQYFREDQVLLRKLKDFDVLVFSECIPNAFWRGLFAVEKLRQIVRRPVLLYEVYYLGNAPTQVQKLQEAGDCLQERFDWHLSVSPLTEVRLPEQSPWSCIGLHLAGTGLAPVEKRELVAVVDFPHPGYESLRAEQLKVLEELGVTTICLEGTYSIEEIRAVYQKAAFYFMQSSEAFGLPIAECLSCGAVVFTASSAWPMSWRLDESPEVHGEGRLGEGLFYVYQNEEHLKRQLRQLIKAYDAEKTPTEVFHQFTTIYPYYYYGRPAVLKQVLEKVCTN